jgi:hypothetical protein
MSWAFFVATLFAIASALAVKVVVDSRYKWSAVCFLLMLLSATAAWIRFGFFARIPGVFVGHNEYGALIRIDLLVIVIALGFFSLLGAAGAIGLWTVHVRMRRT